MADRLTRRELLRWTGAGTGVAVGGVGTTTAQSETERQLTVEGTGLYDFEVRNDLRPGDGRRPPEQPIETTEDGNTRVQERVLGGVDTFLFTGELDVVWFNAESVVTKIDGEPVDLGSMTERNTLTVGRAPNPEVLDGMFALDEAQFLRPNLGTGNLFELEVESGLAESAALVEGGSGSATTDGNVATGGLGPIDETMGSVRRQSFTYDGAIERFVSLNDPAVGFLNGKPLSYLADSVSTHTITIISNDGENVPYKLSVQGDLRKASDLQKATPLDFRFPKRSIINEGDTIDQTDPGPGQPIVQNVDGSVRGGWDSYEFYGDLVRLSVFGDATVWLDGTVLDFSRRRLSIARTGETVAGTDQRTEFEFEVTQTVPDTAQRAIPEARAVGPGWGSYDDETVRAAVNADGQRTYDITGELVRFTAEDPVDVELDGEEIRPMDVVEEHTVTYIKGTDAADAAQLKYRLEIDDAGTLRLDDALNAKTTDRELNGHVPGGEGVGKVRENFARGAVFGNRDSYVFTGEVTWAVAGDALITILDGEEVTAEELAKQ